MKKYLGTNLTEDEYRALGVRAAETGTSRSALMAKLVRNYLAKYKAAKGKEVAP